MLLILLSFGGNSLKWIFLVSAQQNVKVKMASLLSHFYQLQPL